MPVEFTSIDVTDFDLTIATQKRLVRESLRKAANYHRTVTMGDHFKKNRKTAPGGDYGYAVRSVRYMAQKLKKYKTDLPLVRTGRLRRWVRSNSVVTATSTRGARLRIKSPFPMTPERRKELEAFPADERAKSREVANEFFRKEASKPSNQRKRKRRIK